MELPRPLHAEGKALCTRHRLHPNQLGQLSHLDLISRRTVCVPIQRMVSNEVARRGSSSCPKDHCCLLRSRRWQQPCRMMIIIIMLMLKLMLLLLLMMLMMIFFPSRRPYFFSHHLIPSFSLLSRVQCLCISRSRMSLLALPLVTHTHTHNADALSFFPSFSLPLLLPPSRPPSLPPALAPSLPPFSHSRFRSHSLAPALVLMFACLLASEATGAQWDQKLRYR